MGTIKIPTTDSTYEIDGALTVNSITATSGLTGTASVATTVATAATTDSTCSVALLESATGNQGIKSDAGLTYDATANTLSCTASVATQVVTTENTGSTGRVAILGGNSGGNQAVQYSANLTFSPSTGALGVSGKVTADTFSGRLINKPFILSTVAGTAGPAGLVLTTNANSGKMYFTRGSAAQIVTLPAAADVAESYFTFLSKTDQDLTILCPAGTLIAPGNNAATSVAFSTAMESKIGACIEMYSDGTNWYAISRCKLTLTVA